MPHSAGGYYPGKIQVQPLTRENFAARINFAGHPSLVLGFYPWRSSGFPVPGSQFQEQLQRPGALDRQLAQTLL